MSAMLERLRTLEDEHAEIEARLGDPDVAADNKRFVQLSRRYAELSDLVAVGRRLRERTEDLDVAKSLLIEASSAEKEELRVEATEAEADIERLSQEFRLLLLPKDPNEGRNVIVEIRGAEGARRRTSSPGTCSRCTRRSPRRQGWRFEMVGASALATSVASTRSRSLLGRRVWTTDEARGRPHRVQRVPVTESQGRVHTSSATVTVLPEAEEVDVEIDPNDLRIDTYRSSGAGGQHVNTTDSAVRITHLPTGETVSMQDEKSQLQNRERGSQGVALPAAPSGNRSSVRPRHRRPAGSDRAAAVAPRRSGPTTYKENRVTDHRIGLTIHKLDRIVAGELDEISDALVTDERSRASSRESRGRLSRWSSTARSLAGPAAGDRHRLRAAASAMPSEGRDWIVEEASGVEGTGAAPPSVSTSRPRSGAWPSRRPWSRAGRSGANPCSTSWDVGAFAAST